MLNLKSKKASLTIFIYIFLSLKVYSTKSDSNYIEVMDLPLCVGQRLDFECVSTGLTRNDFIDWNVTIIQDSGSRLSDTRLVSAAGQSVIRPITLNMINFSINSTTTEAANGSVTLTSFMSVSNVTSLLNGTQITCSEVRLTPAGDNLILPVREARIYVITTDNINIYSTVSPLEVNSEVTKFGPESVMVTVVWQQERGASYNVSVLPQVVMNMSGPTTLQLTLAYNTLYNVTIATAVCEQTLPTTDTQLHYVKCLNLFEQFEDSSIRVTGYSDPALEGTNVTFQCVSPGLSFFLDGPNSSVCKANGQWEPDPTEIKCTVDCGVPEFVEDVDLSYNSTLEGSEMVANCEGSNETIMSMCLESGSWSPNPRDSNICTSNMSTETVVITITVSITMFIIGVVVIVGAAVIVFKIKRLKLTKKKSLNISLQVEQIQVDENNDSETFIENLPSQYSLLENFTQTSESRNQEKTKGSDHQLKETLVYADVGPFSIKKQPVMSTLNQEDVRVEYSQVNLNIKKQPKPQKKDNEILKYPADDLLNLDSLLIQLQTQVTPKWYQFGEAVGMENETLVKYSQYPAEQCIIEVLDYWLRKHTGTPTWREVAEILRRIGLQQLAFDIERVYETGRLPIEVNINDEVLLESTLDREHTPPPPIPPRCEY